MEFILPDFDTILSIHTSILEESGGLEGLPRPEYIHSAIARPQQYLAYTDNTDLHLIAALILDAIVRHHAFADGNKRTALLTCLWTYELNGTKFSDKKGLNEKFEELVLWVAKEKPEIKVIRNKLKSLVEEFSE